MRVKRAPAAATAYDRGKYSRHPRSPSRDQRATACNRGKYSRHPRSPSRDQRATACNRGKYCQSPSPYLYGELGRCRRGCRQHAVRCRREWTANHGTLPHHHHVTRDPATIIHRYHGGSLPLAQAPRACQATGDQQAPTPSLHSKRSMSSGSRRR